MPWRIQDRDRRVWRVVVVVGGLVYMLHVSGPNSGRQGKALCGRLSGWMACSFRDRSSEKSPALAAQGRIILIIVFPIEPILKLLTLPVQVQCWYLWDPHEDPPWPCWVKSKLEWAKGGKVRSVATLLSWMLSPNEFFKQHPEKEMGWGGPTP